MIRLTDPLYCSMMTAMTPRVVQSAHPPLITPIAYAGNREGGYLNKIEYLLSPEDGEGDHATFHACLGRLLDREEVDGDVLVPSVHDGLETRNQKAISGLLSNTMPGWVSTNQCISHLPIDCNREDDATDNQGDKPCALAPLWDHRSI